MNEGLGALQPPLLCVENISVVFGPLVAVRDVTLRLHGGDLLGLIGPNGAGKTTLMRAMTSLQPLSRGEVKIMDLPLNGDREVLRYIGFTPDTPPMYEELTVRQFLRFIAMGYFLSGSEVGERIDFWLEQVWLTEKANQKIKSLSRGMRQRVGIARTLIPNPSVILLDEPAAGLDPAGRAQFRQLLLSLREQKKAIIVSSHILADMTEYCTHIGIMSAGRLVQMGTVAQVTQNLRSDRCRYTILLARPVENFRAHMGGMPGVSDVRGDDERVTIQYSSGRDAATALLAELISFGFPVAGFNGDSDNLEDAYLRTGIRQVE